MSEAGHETGGPLGVGLAVGAPAARGGGPERHRISLRAGGDEPERRRTPNAEVLEEAAQALEALAVFPGESVYHRVEDVERGQRAARLLRGDVDAIGQ